MMSCSQLAFPAIGTETTRGHVQCVLNADANQRTSAEVLTAPIVHLCLAFNKNMSQVFEIGALLNENDLFLYHDHVKRWTNFIFIFIVGLGVLYVASVQVAKRIALFKDVKSPQLQEVCFMIVATLKNAILMFIGLHHFLFTLPAITATTVEERITGFESMAVLSAIQLAYNIYSIPLSLILGEKKDMMIHHVAVLVVSFQSTFFTNGYRYHCPYFYGVVEMTTIAFAVMQAFKTVPEWIQKYPGTYSAVRIAFAIPFLSVRVVLWVPQVSDVLALTWLVIRTCDSHILRFFVCVQLLSELVLTGLQFYWGFLIIKAFVKHGKKTKQQKED